MEKPLLAKASVNGGEHYSFILLPIRLMDPYVVFDLTHVTSLNDFVQGQFKSHHRHQSGE